VLLSFLKIKVIVNGREIYPLLTTKPVVIPVKQNNPRIVVTDGYHITRPLKLVYKDLHTYCFRVVCAISDLQLIVGFVVLAGFYLTGYLTGILFFKIFCFAPVLYLLVFYYLSRRDFIRITPVLD
jgi:hypothetical protein